MVFAPLSYMPVDCGYCFGHFHLVLSLNLAVLHRFLSWNHHFFLCLRLFVLHILSCIQHAHLQMTFQLVSLFSARALSCRICLCVERLASFVGLLFNVYWMHLLSVGVHLGTFGSSFVTASTHCHDRGLCL